MLMGLEAGRCPGGMCHHGLRDLELREEEDEISASNNGT